MYLDGEPNGSISNWCLNFSGMWTKKLCFVSKFSKLFILLILMQFQAHLHLHHLWLPSLHFSFVTWVFLFQFIHQRNFETQNFSKSLNMQLLMDLISPWVKKCRFFWSTFFCLEPFGIQFWYSPSLQFLHSFCRRNFLIF